MHLFKFITIDPQSVAFHVPFTGISIAWYGIIFATGLLVSVLIYYSLSLRLLPRKDSKKLVDGLSIFSIFGILIGARAFHLIFYENCTASLSNLFRIFNIWERGLASHGGLIGFIIGVYCYKMVKRPNITALQLLSLSIVPALFLGGVIRLGNLMNQEIVGNPSQLPWAIILPHPCGAIPNIPRHPVQIYESISYFLVATIMYANFNKIILRPYLMVGITLLLTFSLRFVIEFFKEEQSLLCNYETLNMGHILSIPFIIAGVSLTVVGLLLRGKVQAE